MRPLFVRSHPTSALFLIVAAILVLFSVSGSLAADAKKTFKTRIAEIEAQQQLDRQLRMLMPNRVFAWRLPAVEGEFAGALSKAVRGTFASPAGEIRWDGVFEIGRESPDIFSERYRKTRLVLTIEGVVFDPNDSLYWFQALSS